MMVLRNFIAKPTQAQTSFRMFAHGHKKIPQADRIRFTVHAYACGDGPKVRKSKTILPMCDGQFRGLDNYNYQTLMLIRIRI